MTNDNHDTLEPTVYIIFGRVWDNSDGVEEGAIQIHALLTAADEDSAVRRTLDALSSQGFVEAELDQLGVLDGEPDEPIYEGAYQDALSGNVAVITLSD
ncbi:MAG: regulator [Rhodobacteraceae bacterium]|nr:regulator [Paracoccaceae bacterium]